MPSNALLASAEKPAGPVTCATTPSGESCRGKPPELVDGVDQHLFVSAREDRNRHDRPRAVLRDATAADVPPTPGMSVSANARRRSSIALAGPRVEAVRVAEDDDRRRDVARRELARGLEHLHRLRLPGEEARRLVLLRALELADERAERHDREQPQRQDGELGAPARHEVGEHSHVRPPARRVMDATVPWTSHRTTAGRDRGRALLVRTTGATRTSRTAPGS